MNRHYSSAQGRFTSVDPIGMEAASLDNPQTLNMYSYCGNDPINHVDPDGLFFGKLFGWIGKALKFLFKVAAVAVAVVAVLAAASVGQYWGSILITKGVVAALFGSSALLATAGWAPGKIGQIAGAIVTAGLSWGSNFRTPKTFPDGAGVGPISNFQAAKKSSAKPKIAPMIFVGAIETINIADKAPDEAPDKAPSTFSDCFNKYKFTRSVGTLLGSDAESVAEVLSVTSYISFAGDMLATAAKASGKTLGRPQPYASGINWAFRRVSKGGARGVLTAIGGRVLTPAFAVTAVFTGSYDLTIAAQCASGILK